MSLRYMKRFQVFLISYGPVPCFCPITRQAVHLTQHQNACCLSCLANLLASAIAHAMGACEAKKTQPVSGKYEFIEDFSIAKFEEVTTEIPPFRGDFRVN